ncbi:hypothetical protein Hypma_003804 [Hypsizygus marmoreus]|uniref:mRNA-decapping enzyme 1B n=1 Tax=Hypsizygus marmoreus TaxID=39966 RepID=A0A369K4N8_HYPMA|nr:hypothetical protein Hypma_003804 [Hypsizygus marmoreus]
MGPSPRNSRISPTENDSLEQPQSPVALRPPDQPPKPPPKLGMTPASRYQHNLKVLRRRDPSILSIFDQFSHVCLYHHNGTKWEKQGYEGSMFLYERESYPPYGFYILNRMGMDDHIQRLYPEDTIGAHGSYVIIRSYPEFTDRRLALARTSPSNEIPHKFSDVYAIPNVEKLTAAQKGEAQTIGLWMFATDAREPLIDVFTRLHSYIKKNQPYPQEFRYGPDRPPPSNPPSRAAILAALPTSSQSSQVSSSTSRPDRGQFQANHPSQASSNGGTSELDKLFAKIEPTPILSPAVVASTAQSQPQQPLPYSTSKMTVESLFAALGGSDLMHTADHRPSSTTSLPPASSTSMSTGLSLLDSIFASANPSISRPATTQPTPSTSNESVIYSPAPTTTALALPQVLNQDVISTLLGLPPSRTASAASTTYSTGAQSHPSSREGDNEDESYAGSDGYSESSTVLDPEAEYDEALQSAGASAGRPLLADGAGLVNGHSNGFLGTNGGGEHGGRIHGDVTPRAPLNGFITPPFVAAARLARFPGAASLPPSIEQSYSSSTVTGPPSRTHSQPQQARTLVPFEPDSELWPYPRSGDGAGTTQGEEAEDEEDGEEIIELDFSDTRALSDPSVFQRALRNGHGNGNGRHARGSSTSSGDGFGSGANGNTNGRVRENGKEREKERGNRRKKGKRERAADQVRLRAEIENSWDVPVPVLAGSSSAAAARGFSDSDGIPEPASPSPCPSPVMGETQQHAPDVVQRTPAQNGVRSAKPMKEKTRADVVRESVVEAVVAKKPAVPTMERNDFVREVLTLIHTDKSFVDTLWQEYTSRVG